MKLISLPFNQFKHYFVDLEKKEKENKTEVSKELKSALDYIVDSFIKDNPEGKKVRG